MDGSGAVPPLIQSDISVSCIRSGSQLSEFVGPVLFTNAVTIDSTTPVVISDTLLGGSWKLKSLEFSNLFCYGPDNIITFDKSKGIVGIVAPNHSGKSSILDVILLNYLL